METSWQNITRRLDIVQATRDTTFDKTKAKGRGLAKIPYRFTVPSIRYNPTDLGLPTGFGSLAVIGSLIATFHFTAPSNFRLLHPIIPSTGATNRVLIAISYREGTTVTRYQIRNLPASIINDDIMRVFMKVACPVYTNQLIKANFSIEYYSLNLTNVTTTQPAINLDTNLLAIPADTDELYVDIPCLETVMRTDIDEAFPEPIPTAYDQSTTWITN